MPTRDKIPTWRMQTYSWTASFLEEVSLVYSPSTSVLSSGVHAILLESKSLGTGQTIDSQGIIHGGLKYAITGHGGRAASAISEMPAAWRSCLAGEEKPDLQNVVMRSDFLPSVEN